MGGSSNMHKFIAPHYILGHYSISPQLLYFSVINTNIAYYDANKLFYPPIQLYPNGCTIMIFNLLKPNNVLVQGPLSVNPMNCDIHIGHVLNGYPCISRKGDSLVCCAKYLLHQLFFLNMYLHAISHYQVPQRDEKLCLHSI